MADKPPSMRYAVREALRALSVRDEDRAAVALARRYADEIDRDPPTLAKLGPLLLAALESLGMTPKGRALVVGKEKPDDARKRASKLDKLRERHESARAREHGA